MASSSTGNNAVALASGTPNVTPASFWRRYIPSRTTATVGAALLGVGSLMILAQEYKSLKQLQDYHDNEKSNKKQCLVIPFDRLKLTQEPKSNSKFLELLQRAQNPGEEPPVTMPVRELVHLIHQAAQDPTICALYGRFGLAPLQASGWADLEEVRNALLVFAQSHRRHANPNWQHEARVIPVVKPKPMYAYAPTLWGLGGNPGNFNYYLASVFSSIHLQQHGTLDLLGLSAQNLFLRGFLEKYGIKVHVFKHGAYKNAPNMFTERTLNREHRENVENLVNEVDSDLCLDIARARSTALLSSWLTKDISKKKKNANDDDSWNNKVLTLWKKIHESGTFPAWTAWRAGLVDYVPKRDPLPDLVAYNAAETLQEKQDIARNWDPQETDFATFPATSTVSLERYAAQCKQLQQLEKKRQFWQQLWADYIGNYMGNLMEMPSLLVKPGEKDASLSTTTKPKTKEQILLLNVSGGITDSTARKLVKQLRQAFRKQKKDEELKCVVLRVTSPGGDVVSSETISQELQALPVPVVVSMGNVAASGGYYISAHADRIFASSKTITGSIGVFAIRADLTELAARHGIRAEHVNAGELSATMDPLTPMTGPMKQNIATYIDRVYVQFKEIVQAGRHLEDVEHLAQGKVWTGRQAKEIGLVDEIGGLERAIAYAKRSFAEDPDHAVVVTAPKEKSFAQMLKSYKGSTNPLDGEAADDDIDTIRGNHGATSSLWQSAYSFIFEEDHESITEDDFNPLSPTLSSSTKDFGRWLTESPSVAPGTLSGVLLTTDENTAIQVLLKDSAEKK